jgi:phospholipase C
VHNYTDDVSILKFIERNWHLDPLTARSRDNLPNPHPHKDNPYLPVNSPAIGDLFDMFDFGRGAKNGHHTGGRDMVWRLGCGLQRSRVWRGFHQS